jgi:hypothetical protein
MAPPTATEPEVTDVASPAVAEPAAPSSRALTRVQRRASARSRALTIGPLVALVAAVATWALSLDHIRLERMNDFGLVSALPPAFFAAVGLLSFSFFAALSARRVREPLLLLHVAALMAILYATPALVEEVPRFAVSWRHLGIAGYVVEHGSVDPSIDAYFNWPGFFFLSGLITRLAGVPNLSGSIAWAPLFFEALYLLPLLVIIRSFTRDKRLTWLAVWLFYATNWIGQDYFSPQALSLFVYMTMLAVLVRWFPGPGSRPAITGARRAWLMAAVIVIFAALVPSHQLSPFVALVAVSVLVVFRRCDARGLPTLMAVLIAAWITFMAVAYLSGHFEQLTGDVGNVSESVGQNVGERVHGSSEHLMVIYIRLALTGALWSLAAIGFVRRARAGRREYTMVLLAGAPFLLLPLQPYGGELLLRVFLFTLPFMAYLAAAAAFPRARAPRTWLLPGVAALVSIALLAACLVSRYGNERMDAFSGREVAAIERLYEIAPPGSILVGGGSNTPWKFDHYADYRYRYLTYTAAWHSLDPLTARPSSIARAIADELGAERKPTYLVFTRRQAAGLEILAQAQRGALEHVEAAIATSPRFKLSYANRDARIYIVTPNPGKRRRA